MESHRILIVVTHSLIILPAHAQSNGTTEATVGYVAGPSGRGTWSLLWGCLVTIFASTWTVLHLNVPGINDSTWTKTLRKAKWMAITVLFPEFILSKAICELRLALDDLRNFDEYLQSLATRGSGLAWEDDFVVHYTTDEGTATDHCRFNRFWHGWSVRYSRFAGLIYWLAGLRIPRKPRKTKNCLSVSQDTLGDNAIQVDSSQLLDNMADSCGTASRRPAVVQSIVDNSKGPQRESHSHNHSVSSIGVNAVGGTDNGERQAQGRIAQVVQGQNDKILITDAETSGRPRLPITPILQKTQHWTLTHSYYANMGGIISTRVVVAGQMHKLQYQVLTGSKLSRRRFRWLGRHPLMGLVLDKAQVENGSKADWLSRGLAVVQITWIVLKT